MSALWNHKQLSVSWREPIVFRHLNVNRHKIFNQGPRHCWLSELGLVYCLSVYCLQKLECESVLSCHQVKLEPLGDFVGLVLRQSKAFMSWLYDNTAVLCTFLTWPGLLRAVWLTQQLRFEPHDLVAPCCFIDLTARVDALQLVDGCESTRVNSFHYRTMPSYGTTCMPAHTRQTWTSYISTGENVRREAALRRKCRHYEPKKNWARKQRLSICAHTLVHTLLIMCWGKNTTFCLLWWIQLWCHHIHTEWEKAVGC